MSWGLNDYYIDLLYKRYQKGHISKEKYDRFTFLLVLWGMNQEGGNIKIAYYGDAGDYDELDDF